METRFKEINKKPVPFRERAWQISAAELLRGFRCLFFRLGFFFLLRFGGGLGLSDDRHIDPFEDGALAGIALSLIEPNYSRVTTTTVFLGRRDFVEEDLHGVFLMEAGSGETTIVQRAVD